MPGLKIPKHVASLAAKLEGSGYIASSQYADLEYAAMRDCKEAVADLEARHADEIKQARREAYEDAAKMADEMFKDTHCGCEPSLCSCEKLNAFAREATEELAEILREKAGKL